MNVPAHTIVLPEPLNDARVRFVFETPKDHEPLSTPRVDVLYTYPPEQHTGLMHWVDELSWFEDDTFFVALELSKFCRLRMKAHPLATRLLEQKDVLDQHVWPPNIDFENAVPTWLPDCNKWLHALRNA